jgi:hypothetical protein
MGVCVRSTPRWCQRPSRVNRNSVTPSGHHDTWASRRSWAYPRPRTTRLHSAGSSPALPVRLIPLSLIVSWAGGHCPAPRSSSACAALGRGHWSTFDAAEFQLSGAAGSDQARRGGRQGRPPAVKEHVDNPTGRRDKCRLTAPGRSGTNRIGSDTGLPRRSRRLPPRLRLTAARARPQRHRKPERGPSSLRRASRWGLQGDGERVT